MVLTNELTTLKHRGPGTVGHGDPGVRPPRNSAVSEDFVLASPEKVSGIITLTRPVWDYHSSAAPQRPPGTTPGLIVICGSPMERSIGINGKNRYFICL